LCSAHYPEQRFEAGLHRFYEGRPLTMNGRFSFLATLPRRIELAWIRLRLGSDTPAYRTAAAALADAAPVRLDRLFFGLLLLALAAALILNFVS
jgi:hypothetical protein